MVDYPFDVVGAALRQSAQWCEILILHINVKSCRASGEEAATRLHVAIGSKSDQSIDEAYPVDFAYRVAENTVSLLRVTLRADTGPLGTHDYLIVLDAQPASGGRTLVRLTRQATADQRCERFRNPRRQRAQIGRGREDTIEHDRGWSRRFER